MSFSYDPAELTAMDQVRGELSDTADTASNPAMFQDETILTMLTRYGQNVVLVAARLADRLAATFARQGTLKVGDLMISGMEQAAFFRSLARNIRGRSNAGPKRIDACEDMGRFDERGAGAAHSGTSEDRPWIAIDR